MPAELLRLHPDPQPLALGTLQAANLPQVLRTDLLPALEELVARHHPEGLWLYSCGEACGYASWARGSASRRSDVDLLVMGLAERRLLDAYDAVLEALLSWSGEALEPSDGV
jgi:predicted nucleotidyltransferase